MKPREWILRVIALLVAWDVVLAACAIAGRLLGYRIWPEVMTWVLIGLVLMLRNSVDAPIPAGTDVDVVGAFQMPWWAARWPTRLVKKMKGK